MSVSQRWIETERVREGRRERERERESERGREIFIDNQIDD